MTLATHQIARLRAHGFRILPMPRPLRRISGIYLYRFTPDDHVDTVVIRADGFAVAARMVNKFDPAEPLAETRAVWSQHGALLEVVDEFLDRYYAADAELTQSRFVDNLDVLQRT